MVESVKQTRPIVPSCPVVEWIVRKARRWEEEVRGEGSGEMKEVLRVERAAKESEKRRQWPRELLE